MSSEAQRLGEQIKTLSVFNPNAKAKLDELTDRLVQLAHQADGGTAGAEGGIEYEAVLDGCAQFSSATLADALAHAKAEGPWAYSIYRVARRLVWHRGEAITPPTAPQDGAPAAEVASVLRALEASEAACTRLIEQYGSTECGVDWSALRLVTRAALFDAQAISRRVNALASQGAEGRQPLSEEELRKHFDAALKLAPEFAPQFDRHRAWAEQFAWFIARDTVRALLSESTTGGKSHE